MRSDETWVDATPYRISQAYRDGLDVDVFDIALPSGIPSGYKHRIIQNPFDSAMKRGVIDMGQCNAAYKYMALLYKSQKESGLVVDLVRTSSTRSTSSGSETRIDNARMVSEANHTLPADVRACWDTWAREVLCGRAGLSKLGAIYYAARGEQKTERQNTRRGNSILSNCLSNLEAFFDRKLRRGRD